MNNPLWAIYPPSAETSVSISSRKETMPIKDPVVFYGEGYSLA